MNSDGVIILKLRLNMIILTLLNEDDPQDIATDRRITRFQGVEVDFKTSPNRRTQLQPPIHRIVTPSEGHSKVLCYLYEMQLFF